MSRSLFSAASRSPVRRASVLRSGAAEQVSSTAKSLQAKLKIGAKGDSLEQEADATAEKVVSVPERTSWKQAEWENQPRMSPEDAQKSEEAQKSEDEAQKSDEQAQSAPEEAQAAPEEAAAAPEEAQAAPEEAQSTAEEVQSAPEAPQASAAAEVQSAPEDVKAAPEEEAQAAPEEMQSAPEEAQMAPEEGGEGDAGGEDAGGEGAEELSDEDFEAGADVFEDDSEVKASPDEQASKEGAEDAEEEKADGGGAYDASPEFEQEVAAMKSGGEPLPPKAKAFMEERFGADFSKVRIHTGKDADRLCKQIGAQAFAIGHHIFFANGKFDPESRKGRFLLAHELTHVVQQKGGIRTREEQAAATEDAQTAPEEPQAAPEEAAAAPEEVSSAPEEAQASPDETQFAPEEAQAAPEEAQASPEEAQPAPDEAQASRAVSAAPVGKNISRTNRSVQGGWLANKINKFARHVPGYTLITVLVGYNPILGESVPRTAMNLVGGLLGLIPGGTALFDKLKESGALQEAFDWLSAEVTKLNLSWEGIKKLLEKAWDDMSLIRGFSYNLKVIVRTFAPTVKRIVAFGKAIGTKIMELVFKGALKLVGAPVEKFMALINKGKAVLGKIFSDPIQFVKNLANSVKMGIQLFLKNIVKHLKSGLIGWITGALGGAGIELPAKFDIKGIFSLVMQILGLTYDRMRVKLVKRLGEKTVGRIEKAVEFITLLVTKGPIALWDKLKEKLSGIKDAVMGGIRDFIITKVVTEGITWILGLLNPVGALLKIIKVLYSIVMFFIERWSQIVDFATSVFNSIGEIANGQLAKAAAYVEATIGKAVPIMISFLASLLGLGGISAKIQKVIKKIRKPIDKGVDKILDWIVKKAKALIAKVTGKGKKGGKDDKAPKSIDGMGVDKVLAQPPTKEPRSAAVKKTELKQAVDITKLISKKAKTTEEVAKYFPKMKKRFGLKKIEYKGVGKSGTKIHIELNPVTDVEATPEFLQGDTSNLTADSVPDNMKTKVNIKSGKIEGHDVGIEMDAETLGPDHPLGSMTTPGVMSTFMAKLEPPGSAKQTYYKGHLLHFNLGGPGNDHKNLFPITASANKLHDTRVERALIKKVNKEGYWMRYHVKVIDINCRPRKDENDKDIPNKFSLASTVDATAWHLLSDGTVDTGSEMNAKIRSEENVKGDAAIKVEGDGKATGKPATSEFAKNKDARFVPPQVRTKAGEGMSREEYRTLVDTIRENTKSDRAIGRMLGLDKNGIQRNYDNAKPFLTPGTTRKIAAALEAARSAS